MERPWTSTSPSSGGRAGSVRALVKRADWKSAHADGDITLAKGSAQSRGQLRVSLAQLQDLRDLLGLDLGGSLTGTVALHSDQGHTQAQLKVDALDLSLGQLAGNAQLSAQGPVEAMGFELDVQLPKFRGGKASLSAAGAVDVDARSVAGEQARRRIITDWTCICCRGEDRPGGRRLGRHPEGRRAGGRLRASGRNLPGARCAVHRC